MRLAHAARPCTRLRRRPGLRLLGAHTDNGRVPVEVNARLRAQILPRHQCSTSGSRSMPPPVVPTLRSKRRRADADAEHVEEAVPERSRVGALRRLSDLLARETQRAFL